MQYLSPFPGDRKTQTLLQREEELRNALRHGATPQKIIKAAERIRLAKQNLVKALKFDLVTAVETHLFWPDLPANMREVFRILKPGGQVLFVAEIYKGGKHLEGVRKKIFEKHLAANMNLLTPDEHRELFTNAGFSNVQIFEELDKGWICGVGRKA